MTQNVNGLNSPNKIQTGRLTFLKRPDHLLHIRTAPHWKTNISLEAKDRKTLSKQMEPKSKQE
jgi:hypothetical protein